MYSIRYLLRETWISFKVSFLAACCAHLVLKWVVSIYIHKSHNVSVLIYHLVCVCKGRKEWFNNDVVAVLKETCVELQKRYEIHFLEIGTDQDHVHFLIQSVPMYSPTKISRTIKSITARQILKTIPTLKPKLWGGEFWSNGYYINTVGRTNSEMTIQKYIKNQGHNPKDYEQLHKNQLTFFIWCLVACCEESHLQFLTFHESCH